MAIPMILGAVQAGIGAAQAISGWKQKKNLTRPEYQIPEEIERNMSEAELMSYYGMPDAQKQSYMQNIQRAGQQALSGVADRKGGLGTISAIQQQQQDAYMNLLSADVQQRMQNIQRAQQARSEMAAFKDKQFEINEMQPYQQSYAEAQSLVGSGMQNVMGGLNTIATTKMVQDTYGVNEQVNNQASKDRKRFGETAFGGFFNTQAQKLLNKFLPPENFASQGDGTIDPYANMPTYTSGLTNSDFGMSNQQSLNIGNTSNPYQL